MLPKFLSGEMSIDKSFFFVPQFCLKLIGFWPEQIITGQLLIRTIINFMCLCFGTFGEFAFGFIHIDNILMALDAICPAATKFVTAFKLMIFFIFRNQCRLLITEIWNIMQGNQF